MNAVVVGLTAASIFTLLTWLAYRANQRARYKAWATGYTDRQRRRSARQLAQLDAQLDAAYLIAVIELGADG